MTQEPKQTMINQQSAGPNIIPKLVWMLFIGLWLVGVFYFIGVVFTAITIAALIGMNLIQIISKNHNHQSVAANKTQYNPLTREITTKISRDVHTPRRK